MCEFVSDIMLMLQPENSIRLTAVFHWLLPSVGVDILYGSIAKINMLKEIGLMKRSAEFQYVCVYFLNIRHSAETAFLTMQCFSYGNRIKISRDNIYILGLSAPYCSSCSQKFPIKARKRQITPPDRREVLFYRSYKAGYASLRMK
jgi:hypothetical protein